MGKREARTLKELYGVTDKIKEPEITAVLEGNCRIRGPVDEPDRKFCRTNSGRFPPDMKSEFITKNFHMRVESGTCNVCSAPCSSCMHNNWTRVAMESKMECGSSRSSCATNEADSSSFSCVGGMPLYMSRICDDMQHASSEVSNLLSASSSHDSCYENAESKATERTSSACEASGDNNLPPGLPSREAVENQLIKANSPLYGDGGMTPEICHRKMLSQNVEEEQPQGYHGDNMYCITGEDCIVKTGHQWMDSDHGNTIRDEAIGCIHPDRHEKAFISCSREASCHEESLQKNFASSGNTEFIDQPGPAEMHLLSHVSSPKVQSPCPPVCNGNTALHNDDQNVSAAQFHVDGEASIAGNGNLDKIKPPSNEGTICTNALKITDPCSENDHVTDKGIPSNKVMRPGILNMELQLPGSLAEASDVQELQLVMEGGKSESEPDLTDVKVCDICGDAGREDLLAICSRCSDGAEHTYCMRIMLRKVPEADWLCEECQLKDDAEKKTVDRSEKLSGRVKKCKLTGVDETKRVDMSERVSGREKEFKHKEKEVVEVKRVDSYVKVSERAKEHKSQDHAVVKNGEISEMALIGAKQSKQKEFHDEEVDKSKTIRGTPKPAHQTEMSQKLAGQSSSRHMLKLDVKVSDREGRGGPKGLQSPTLSTKRPADTQDVTSPCMKKPKGIPGECIGTSSPRTKPALLREDSFKNLTTGKTRVINMPLSGGNQAVNSPQGFPRLQSMLVSHVSKVEAQLPSPHGFLSRSSSFGNSNSKPKVKHLAQDVILKPKSTKESSLDHTRKVAVGRSMMKSASFKCAGTSRWNTDSVSKTQFIHPSDVEKPRSLKQVTNLMDKKTSSTFDRPVSNLSPRNGTVTSLPKREMKVALHDAQLNNMSKSDIFKPNKASSYGSTSATNDPRKPSIYSAKTASPSVNTKGSIQDEKILQTPVEGARGCSRFTEKMCSNAEAVQHQGVYQPSESIQQDDKTSDSTVLSSSRQAVSGGSQILYCQRCNGTSHATQFCSIDKLQSPALIPSCDKNQKDREKKGNKWKAAVKTSISIIKEQKINLQSEHSEEFPSSSTNLSCELVSRDVLPSSLSQPINIHLLVGSEQEAALRNLDDDAMKASHVAGVQKLVEDSSTAQATEKIDACSPKQIVKATSISDELNKKQSLHGLLDQASKLSIAFSPSTVPELEFIWQGSLDILTTGNEPSPYGGIQAHLSASASPRVIEVASKLPQRVILEEAPWLSSWPLQFQGISPNEDNIAIFFFARDVESYERSYSKLLEKMLKNDLALRGLIDDVELLIFPSTKLPVHSQRWNRLFFLWGIFKGRKPDTLTPERSSHRKPSDGPMSNIILKTQVLPCGLRPIDSDLPRPSVDCDLRRPVSVEIPDDGSPRSNQSPKLMTPTPSVRAEMRVNSQGNADKICQAQRSSTVHNSLCQSTALQLFPQRHCLGSINSPSNLHSSAHCPESRLQMTNTASCSEVKSDLAYQIDIDVGGRHFVPTTAYDVEVLGQIGFQKSSHQFSSYSDCKTGIGSCLKGADEVGSIVNACYDPQQKQAVMECFSREKSYRRPASSSSPEAVSMVSGEATKSPCESMLLKDKANFSPFCMVTDDQRSSAKVHPLVCSSPSDQHFGIIDGKSKVTCPDNTSRQKEMFFFPVQPSSMQNTPSGDLIHILSSDDEDASESNSLDLKLAIGGDKRKPQQALLEEPTKDDISTSLSLSLAIPSSEMEWQKPSLKSEQHLQDRPEVNTTLLLFGSGFTGS